MKQKLSLNQPYIITKIIGIILITIGLVFFLEPTSLNIKIGFSSILIGILIIFITTQKSISQQISNIEIKGNINAVKKLIRELDLRGNAVFISKTGNLTEERIFIPPNNSAIIQIPAIDNENVLLTGVDDRNLGISIPPSGLQLLNEIEKEEN